MTVLVVLFFVSKSYMERDILTRLAREIELQRTTEPFAPNAPKSCEAYFVSHDQTRMYPYTPAFMRTVEQVQRRVAADAAERAGAHTCSRLRRCGWQRNWTRDDVRRMKRARDPVLEKTRACIRARAGHVTQADIAACFPKYAAS